MSKYTAPTTDEGSVVSLRLANEMQRRYPTAISGLSATDQRDASLTELLAGTSEVFNVRSYGAKGDGTTDDTAAIQAANDAAELVGGTVAYPPPSSEYLISDRILVGASVTHVGQGWSTAIRQSTWGKPVFEISGASDVSVRSLKLLSTETKAVIAGNYEGEPARDRSAGVYINSGDRLRVDSVWVHGFVDGVRLRGNTDGSTLSKDAVVRNCLMTGVDFGILAQQQQGCQISQLRGADIAVSQTGNPSHLIYFTPGNASVSSEECSVVQSVCRDNVGGSAFQFKKCKRMNASGLTSETCLSFMSFQDVQDSVFSDLVSVGSTSTDTDVADIFFIDSANVRNVFNGINITYSTDTNGISLLANSADNTFVGVFVRASMTSGSGAAPIFVRGTNNRFINPHVQQTNAAKLGIWLNAGSDHLVENPKIEGSSDGVQVDSVTDCVVRYTPNMIESTGEDVDDNGTTTIIVRQGSSTVTTLANEDTPSVAASDAFITGGTTTITDFDDGVVGQTISILSAHAVTITDGSPIILNGSANFVMAAADTLTLTMFNDQVWQEVSRTVN